MGIPEPLRVAYLSSIPAKIAHLEELVQKLRQGEDLKNELRLQVHKLAGNSGTYGFPSVSALCKSFEQTILSDPNYLNQCDQFLATLKKEFKND